MSQPDIRPSQQCTEDENGQKGVESCQEEVERGSHDVSGPWIEVTIIPVVRLEIHLEKGHRWPQGHLAVEREDSDLRTKQLGVERQDPGVWGERTCQRKTGFSYVEVQTCQEQSRIMPCGGNVTQLALAYTGCPRGLEGTA